MKYLSPEEQQDLILSVGTHRSQRRLQPVVVAQLIKKSLSAGATADDISHEITLSDRVIQKFLSLLSLPADIWSLVGWGSSATSISFTSAAEIARLSSIEEQRYLTKACLEHQLSVPEMKQVIQIRHRSNRPIEQTLEEVIKQRPSIEKRYLIIGKITSEKLSNRLKALPQYERDKLFLETLNKNGLGNPTYGAKLDFEFFYIFGDSNYQGRVMALPNGFENTITDYLAVELNCQ